MGGYVRWEGEMQFGLVGPMGPHGNSYSTSLIYVQLSGYNIGALGGGVGVVGIPHWWLRSRSPNFNFLGSTRETVT